MAEVHDIEALIEAKCAQAVAEAEQRLLLPFARGAEVRFATDVSQFDAAQAFEVAVRDRLAHVRFSLRRARQDAEYAEAEYTATARENRQAMAAARADPSTVRRATRRLRASQRGKLPLKQAEEEWSARVKQQRDWEEREEDLRWRLRACIAWLEEQPRSVELYKVERVPRRRENDLPPYVRWYRAHDFWAQPGREPQHGGTPYGYEWTLEVEDDPWRPTTWVIFWLNSGEIYATQSPRREDDDRIVLLGFIPYPRMSYEDRFLDELARRPIMSQRNSLVLAAETIVAEQLARERNRLMPPEP